jgi:hypothetical protein
MPLEFFEKCLKIKNGNIQESLELAWDFLSRGWDAEALERSTRIINLKFYDITGEQSKMHYSRAFSRNNRVYLTARGDNFGAWYHFFGTALHSFVRQNSRVLGVKWRLPTDFYIFLEETVYEFGSQKIDFKKRVEIDKAGSIFGRDLYRILSNEKLIKELTQRTPKQYLYQNTQIYNDTWPLKDGQSAVDYKTIQVSNQISPMEFVINYLKILEDKKYSEIENLIKNHLENGPADIVFRLAHDLTLKTNTPLNIKEDIAQVLINLISRNDKSAYMQSTLKKLYYLLSLTQENNASIYTLNFEQFRLNEYSLKKHPIRSYCNLLLSRSLIRFTKD